MDASPIAQRHFHEFLALSRIPDLLRIETAQWSLSIWCKDISPRQRAYERTINQRNSRFADTELRWSMPLVFTAGEACGHDNGLYSLILPTQSVVSLTLARPIFFENSQYMFEWEFAEEDVSEAGTEHRLKHVNDVFRFANSRQLARLTGPINTGNDIGWFRLPVFYQCNGVVKRVALSFEVLPVKMDLHRDMAIMYEQIDSEFPLWRFSLARKTNQPTALGQEQGYFSLLWLENFNRLRQELDRGLQIITAAPHRRLQRVTRQVKADRLTGKIGHKLAEKVLTDVKCGQYEQRYQQDKKQLSVDTPENRFIKMVVTTTKKRLADFHQKLVLANKSPDKQRLSSHFLAEVASWQQPLQRIEQQGMLRDVGTFTGLNSESLVLQQKTGYSAVYRIWQALKFFLDVFAEQTTISMKSIAQVYEVWCFLAIRRLLIEQLAFVEVKREGGRLNLTEFEYQLTNGLLGAFNFERADGVKVRLVHEPIFGKDGKEIRSELVTQKPDILLEVTFPNGKQCIWLFDAKYRIKEGKDSDDALSDDPELVDRVPNDVINQMHRYRDAIIKHKQTVTGDQAQKSRPVFGGFALYPGVFDQKNQQNPYAKPIEKVGIGAFALLPSKDSQQEDVWLMAFLQSQIGKPLSRYAEADEIYAADRAFETLSVQDAARISSYGMTQTLYPDLVMTAALGGSVGRQKAYFEGFKNGTAKYYHLKQSTFRGKFKQHVVEELRFLALAISTSDDAIGKIIPWLWPINQMQLIPRDQITEAQSGKSSNSKERYFLFELGKPLALKDPLTHVPHRPIANTLKLTTISRIEKAQRLSDLALVYENAFVSPSVS